MNPPQVAVAPLERPDIERAIVRAGGRVAPVQSADALIWNGDDPPLLGRLLHPQLRWVQFCASGVDTWMEAGVIDRDRAWTAAKGVGAGPMAEHALALMLAGARELPALAPVPARGGRRAVAASPGRSRASSAPAASASS